jgi:hypothetical protein
MKMIYRMTLASLVFLLIVSACSSSKPPSASNQTPNSANALNQPTEAAQASQAYPAPGSSPNNPAYPAPSATQTGDNATAYPGPATAAPQNQQAVVPVTPFKFDKPIVEGTTEVTGVGPAGAPIVLKDITSSPVVLAYANIMSDGKFTFKVIKPLEKDHRLGVALFARKDSPWVDQNFTDPGFQGTEPQQAPDAGFFYDTAVVQAK